MKLKYILFFIFFFYIFLFFNVTNVSASSKFAIGPSNLDFGIVDRGESKTLPVKIYSQENLSLKIEVTGIEWLELPNMVKLSAGEARVINVTVFVPENAEPGDHWGSINFIPVIEKEPGKVKIVIGKGIRVHVKVPGEIIISEEIIDFSNVIIPEGTENVIFKILIKNTGTVTAVTGASVIVEGYEEKVANVKTPIKPNLTQEFRIEYPTKDIHAGNYTVIATVFYDGKTVTKEAKLIVKPKPTIKLPVMFYAVIVIISVIVIIATLWLKKKKSNIK